LIRCLVVIIKVVESAQDLVKYFDLARQTGIPTPYRTRLVLG